MKKKQHIIMAILTIMIIMAIGFLIRELTYNPQPPLWVEMDEEITLEGGGLTFVGETKDYLITPKKQLSVCELEISVLMKCRVLAGIDTICYIPDGDFWPMAEKLAKEKCEMEETND